MSCSRTRERITWRVTPAGRATRPHVLARSVYQGATGDRRMLVFAGLPAARQRDRGGGLGEREMERREGHEAAIGRISPRRDEDEGCAGLARATKEKHETGKISVRRKDEEGEKRDGEKEKEGGRIPMERRGGWWEGRRGMEEEWRGGKGLEGTKTQGGGGKNEATVERDTREHRGGWQRGSARRGNRGGGGVEIGEGGGEIRLAPRSLAWSRRRRSWPLRRRNGSKDLRPSSSRHSVPSPSSSPLERATCPSDQRTPPPTIDPKSVGTSVILADITRLMLARSTRVEKLDGWMVWGRKGERIWFESGKGDTRGWSGIEVVVFSFFLFLLYGG